MHSCDKCKRGTLGKFKIGKGIYCLTCYNSLTKSKRAKEAKKDGKHTLR